MIYDIFHAAKEGWWVFSWRQWISLLGGRYITRDSETGVRCVSKGVCLLELATMASGEPGVMDSTNFLFSTVPMACLFHLPNRCTSH